MSFDDELESFQAYAAAMPNNCVFLVDTYDTAQGVRHAVEVGRWLKSQGREMVGIRLDSGDLAYLSIQARKILDEGGFPDAVIIASNDLDEHIITSLKQQGAKIGFWGVGTKLVTAYDQPALGGVYKLAAVRERGTKEWTYKLKLSEQAIKVSTPGILQVRRFIRGGEYVGDMIYNEEMNPGNSRTIVDPADLTRRKAMGADATTEDLLVPIFREGKLVYREPALIEIRAHVQAQLKRLYGGTKRLLHPHEYPVGLEPKLHELKTELILKNRMRSLTASANP
jgi:nicotinate phosphoribosyltransferase